MMEIANMKNAEGGLGEGRVTEQKRASDGRRERED